ncbi:MAG: hypothetical protein HUJ83_11290 [Veillonella sp.]|nr:hypothetical protein [Veillonella sp.]
MKIQIALSLLLIAAAVTYGYKSGANKGNKQDVAKADSTEVIEEDSSVADDSIYVARYEIAFDKDIDVKTYEKVAHYRGPFARPFYISCHYRFDDVVKVGDNDMKAYNAALLKFLSLPSGTTPGQVTGKWSEAFKEKSEGQVVAVDTRGEEADYKEWYATHEEDGRDYGFLTYENVGLIYKWYNANANVMRLDYTREYDTGSEVAASYSRVTRPFYYDFDSGRRLELGDLFKGDYKKYLLDAVRKWVADNIDEGCRGPLEEIELSGNWEIGRGYIFFLYEKYEIAFPSYGNVAVPVWSFPIEENLTTKGYFLMDLV